MKVQSLLLEDTFIESLPCAYPPSEEIYNYIIHKKGWGILCAQIAITYYLLSYVVIVCLVTFSLKVRHHNMCLLTYIP